MDSLAAAAGSDFASYDPGNLVRAVNALQPCGATEALDAIERQLSRVNRIDDPQHGLFLVMRVLFDVPDDDDAHPPMHIGIPEVMKPARPEVLPLFPLMLVADVPLLLVTTFVLGGSPQPVEAHIEHFRKHGIIRSGPLEPAAWKADGETVIAEVIASFETRYCEAYEKAPTDSQTEMVRGQIDRMVESTDT